MPFWSAIAVARWAARALDTALDLGSGKELWRAYSTGPDADVKIGANFKPPYSWLAGKDLGARTGRSDAWKRGGSTVWGWISYDPRIDLIYYGTSNPSPRVPAQRPGDNLWGSSIFARSRQPARHAGPILSRPTTSGTMTRQREYPDRRAVNGARRCSSISTVMALAIRWIAKAGRC